MNLQEDLGHEIAIHGVSTIVNHIHWFPSDKFKSYATIEEAVTAIKEFKSELSASGIHTKFVRAPTGLHSQITAYLRQLGVKNEIAAVTARDVIKKELTDFPKDKGAAHTVAVSFNTLKIALTQMQLHLWGGDTTGKISALSWGAESAGAGMGRTDNVPEEPKRRIDSTLAKKLKSTSLVILCHDTTAADVDEVRRDIKDMEAYAKEKDCEIIYHTMSSLYNVVVGRDP